MFRIYIPDDEDNEFVYAPLADKVYIKDKNFMQSFFIVQWVNDMIDNSKEVKIETIADRMSDPTRSTEKMKAKEPLLDVQTNYEQYQPLKFE